MVITALKIDLSEEKLKEEEIVDIALEPVEPNRRLCIIIIVV